MYFILFSFFLLPETKGIINVPFTTAYSSEVKNAFSCELNITAICGQLQLCWNMIRRWKQCIWTQQYETTMKWRMSKFKVFIFLCGFATVLLLFLSFLKLRKQTNQIGNQEENKLGLNSCVMFTYIHFYYHNGLTWHSVTSEHSCQYNFYWRHLMKILDQKLTILVIFSWTYEICKERDYDIPLLRIPSICN